jgi:GTP-binding protein HflX
VSTASRKVVFPWYDEFGVFNREEIIFTDSVGFVYDISPQFIHAFLSTLEELQFSDLLTIVVDIADLKFERLKTKIETTFQVIEQIGASNIPRVIVFNKSDLLDPQELNDRVNITKTYFPETPTITISAKNKLGYEDLIKIFLDFKSKLRPDLSSKKKEY